MLAAMGEAGFFPNAMARGLRGAKTHLVGVCFQELESPILARKTSILQHHLRLNGYRAILELTGGNGSLETEVVRHFLAMQVDGIVLFGSTLQPDDALIHGLQEAACPTVLIDPVNDLPFSKICLAREWAMRLIFDHLCGMGHRRFGFLGIDDVVPYGTDRLNGALREARRYNLSPRRDFVTLSIPSERTQDYNYGWKLANRLQGLEKQPTALIALNDRVAIGAVKNLVDRGFKIPGDYSVIGFDNLEVTAYTNPPLTTIDQQVEVMISTAVKVLMREIASETESAPEHRIIRPIMFERESTGAANA